jgi:hypothetical protein
VCVDLCCALRCTFLMQREAGLVPLCCRHLGRASSKSESMALTMEESLARLLQVDSSMSMHSKLQHRCSDHLLLHCFVSFQDQEQLLWKWIWRAALLQKAYMILTGEVTLLTLHCTDCCNACQSLWQKIDRSAEYYLLNLLFLLLVRASLQPASAKPGPAK